MPKKQKDADVDPLEGVPEELVNVEHAVHATEVIDAYIEEVSEKLYQKHLKTREGPFAAKYVLKQMLDDDQWHIVRHDPGETEGLVAEYDSDMDDEPEPCAIDTYSRSDTQQ